MSLLIKGMDMPKNCDDCSIRSFNLTGMVCCLIDENVTNQEFAYKRHPNCPLSEIPLSHGRLIDEAQTQKNIEDFVRGWCQDTKNDFNKHRDFVGVFIGMIKQAPTIIEAEE